VEPRTLRDAPVNKVHAVFHKNTSFLQKAMLPQEPLRTNSRKRNSAGSFLEEEIDTIKQPKTSTGTTSYPKSSSSSS